MQITTYQSYQKSFNMQNNLLPGLVNQSAYSFKKLASKTYLPQQQDEHPICYANIFMLLWDKNTVGPITCSTSAPVKCYIKKNTNHYLLAALEYIINSISTCCKI